MEILNISLKKHQKYFESLLKGLPEQVHSSYTTGLFFIFSGLKLLKSLPEDSKSSIIDWLYSQQVTSIPFAGFRANSSSSFDKTSEWDYGTLASTYSALCILKLFDDDFSRVRKKEIISSISHQVTSSGSVRSHPGSSENDVRFVYCLCAICHLLDDWEGIDKELITRFLLSCQTYEGGFSIFPGFEAHGGGTYCALSSLQLMGKLEVVERKEELVEWLMMRQGMGFSGRPGKAEDTCYGYWIGLSLCLLGAKHYIARENKDFYAECETPYGGFSKYPDIGRPDLTHSYLGLVGLSLLGEEGLSEVFAPLGIVNN